MLDAYWIQQGCAKFPKTYDPHKNYRRRQGDRKQVSYERPTSNRHQGVNFSDPGDLWFGVCDP